MNTRTRAPERTLVEQWPYRDQLLTTVTHIDRRGREKVSITGVHERLDLSIEDRGHEMVLPERAPTHKRIGRETVLAERVQQARPTLRELAEAQRELIAAHERYERMRARWRAR